MTTDPHPHPDDELASAHLDGATTPQEAARVEAEPELRARVERLRAVRAAVALPDPAVDGDRREQAIAAALAALDEDDAVLSLTMARARRRRHLATRVAGAVVAAAVAAALVLPRVTSDGDPGTTTAAREADQPDLAGEDADAAMDQPFTSSEAPESEGGAASSRAMEVPLLGVAQASDLGSVADLPALAAVAAAAIEGQRTLPPASSGDPAAADACLAALQADAGLAVMLVGVGDVAGRAVVAIVVVEAEGGRHLDVAAVDGCERLGSVPL